MAGYSGPQHLLRQPLPKLRRHRRLGISDPKKGQIIDPENLKLSYASRDPEDPVCKDSAITDTVDLNKLLGYFLCTHKESADKHAEQDQAIVALMQRINELETKLATAYLT